MTDRAKRCVLDVALKVHYERYRTEVARFSAATWAGEKPGLVAFVDQMMDKGAQWVHDVDRQDVETWWEQLAVADSTRVTRLAQLRAFMKFCVEQGWIDKDPSLLLRAAPTAPAVRDRLSAAELLRLVELGRTPRDRALLALAANLGLRGGDIASLRLRDVNLAAGTLRMIVHKTAESDEMPLTQELHGELFRWLAHYYEVCAGLTQDSRLIPSQYIDNVRGRITYRPDRPVGHPYDVVKEALTRLGWDHVKGEGVHTVRRSLARLLFDDVESSESFDSALMATMALLHHTRPETTLRYIGRDRATLARDRVLGGKTFLTRLAEQVFPSAWVAAAAARDIPLRDERSTDD